MTQVIQGNSPNTARFWGRMADFGQKTRIATLAFVLASIVSLSFTQLGFWSIGIIDGKPVYLMLLLGPLVMGAFLFGPFTGALLGLFAGVVVFAHATFLPLDYYEVYFMTPLNTFALLTAIGATAGWLFSIALRKNPSGAARVVTIIAVCAVISFIASVLVQLNTVIAYVLFFYGGLDNIDYVREYLLCSPLGVIVQALIDLAAIALLCSAADAITHLIAQRGDDRKLLDVFCSWMVLISSIVFIVTSGIIFAIVSWQAQTDAEKDMLSEIEYLQKQLEIRENENLDQLLEGYTTELDGLVAITDKTGTVLATDDEDRCATGSSIMVLLGYGSNDESDEDAETNKNADGEQEELIAIYFDVIADGEPVDRSVAAIQASDDNGVETMDIAYFGMGKYADGYVTLLRGADMVYASRFGVMASSTILAILLIVAIAIVASQLLNQVVVQRIDDTNKSLEKITGGDLNERVRAHDSREFTSLSAGINTTVSALRDSIAEAEQKNAQELMTAKAIQESSLPREFPPFPEIDRFDIYASMKTAKEVGGDFYDFFLIGEEKLGFLMADVSGKGIPAALFMMTAKTQIQNYMEADLPIAEAVNAANHQLCIGNDAGMFVTMFACVLNFETGELSYVNAGHNPPLILRNGTWEWMRDVSGLPLGLFDGMPYSAFTRQLEVDDMLYLYTDGVTEAMDVDGNLFSEERLEQTLYKYAAMNPRSVGVGVRRAITDFTHDCEQSDDITMLILKYGVPPQKKAVMILPALDNQLVHVCNFIHEELHRRNAPKSVQNPLDIAAEELFVNVCHYAYPEATPENPGEVRISFEYESNPPSLTVEIADDGIPYNPLEKPDAVTPDDIMEVPIGGLGILMAKRSVDDMAYERKGDSNILTFKKEW